MSLFLEFSLIGIASGGIYVLAALSFVIVYKATNIFNFATGEMMMMGTYFFFLFDTQLGMGWIVGLGAGLTSAALLALIVERSMLRPLIGRPHIVLVMVTFGVGSILRGIAGLVWGPNVRQLTEVLPRKPIFLGDILVPGKLAWGFVTAGVTPLTEAVMMPEAAVRRPASAHASRNTARMLMPRLSAVSWSVEVARIAVPAREKR
jgi:branched-chain amino acid transport system permease protein